jgi:hypothetical protein
MDGFAKLGIRAVFDLRIESGEGQPDRVPEGTKQTDARPPSHRPPATRLPHALGVPGRANLMP